MPQDRKFTLWFDEIGIEDVPKVGGKNASLGEMYQELITKGVKIPNGFATTSDAYWYMSMDFDAVRKREINAK